LYGSYPNLDAKIIINGLRCKTAFCKLKEHVAKWTPESQEAITGVPAQKVYDLTHEYIAQKPSTIYIYLGLRYMNSTQAARCVGLLPVLSGNLPLRGGGFVIGSMPEGHLVALNDAPVMMPEMMPKGDAQQLIPILDSFHNPNTQQYKAFINPFANPVQNMPNRQLWEKEFFPNMELVVVNEIRMTDTAKFADYVLPEATVANSTKECEDEISKHLGEVWLKQCLEMGFHITQMFPPGGWTTNETYWDDLCDVRKAE